MISLRLTQRTCHSAEAAGGETLLGHSDVGGSVPKEKRTVFALATRLLLATLVVVIVSGCGRHKQDLDEAKQRIDNLTAENKRSSEIIANLEKDKRRLTEERQAVDTKIDTLRREVGDLEKSKLALSEEISELKKRNGELLADVNSLRREKADLSRQIEELRPRAADSAKRIVQTPSARPDERTPLIGAGPKMPKAAENMSPCEALRAFMEASEQMARSYKGRQRTDMLEKVKHEYAPRMKGAPEKAIRNAQAWVDELSSSWDKTRNDTVFNLLIKSNAVADACKKNPSDAGR
jgi:septal ring factor EnvC (AmiA/AmiB activator)